MLDISLNKLPAAPSRAGGPAYDRPATASTRGGRTGSFADTLAEIEEPDDPSASDEDTASPASSIPASSPPEAIQPGLAPGWMAMSHQNAGQAEGEVPSSIDDGGEGGGSGAMNTPLFAEAGVDGSGVMPASLGAAPPKDAAAGAAGSETVGASGVDDATATDGNDEASFSLEAESLAAADVSELAALAADTADQRASETASQVIEAHAAAGAARQNRLAALTDRLARQDEAGTASAAIESHAMAAESANLPISSATTSASQDGAGSFGAAGHGAHGQTLAGLTRTASSTSTGTSLTESLPTETAQQIVQAIRLQAARGGGEATIRLEPHHFGEVRIAIKVDHGQVHARVEAETPAVREWLQHNQTVLRTNLAEHDLTLGRLEVTEPRDPKGDKRPGQDGSSQDASTFQRPRRQRRETAGTFEVVA